MDRLNTICSEQIHMASPATMASINEIQEEAEGKIEIEELKTAESDAFQYKRNIIVGLLDNFAEDLLKNRGALVKDKLDRYNQLTKEIKLVESSYQRNCDDLKDEQKKVYADAKEEIKTASR